MIKNFFLIIITMGIFSCKSTRLNCSKFYTYSSKKVNVKGISSNLKKQGVSIADLSVSEISIEPTYVVASERLQELDLLQFNLCSQIKSLPKKDSSRVSATLAYINILQQMLQIAQKPSFSDSISKK